MKAGHRQFWTGSEWPNHLPQTLWQTIFCGEIKHIVVVINPTYLMFNFNLLAYYLNIDMIRKLTYDTFLIEGRKKSLHGDCKKNISF